MESFEILFILTDNSSKTNLTLKTMKKKIFAIAVGLIFMTSLFAVPPKKVTVEDIFDNPGRYISEQVEVIGIVAQYYPTTAQTTSYYILQSSFGTPINVNTIKSPSILRKYKVRGTVEVDPNQSNGRPFIVEHSRTIILPVIIYILGAFVLLLVGFLVAYLLRSTKKTIEKSQGGEQSKNEQEYKTIRIETDGPETMVLMPGLLEILNGPDKGKSFKMSGYPTSEGSVVTIGRENVFGTRKYAHIRLLERTVSRKQAEIVFKNNMMFIKNLSETNMTQVDGRVLDPNAMTELKPGMVIRTGEVEFLYKV